MSAEQMTGQLVNTDRQSMGDRLRDLGKALLRWLIAFLFILVMSRVDAAQLMQ